MAFSLTPAAVHQIKVILGKKPEGTLFRVSVQGGGCSGFKYAFNLIAPNETEDDDIWFDYGIVKVVVDSVSMDLMPDAELDYKNELIGAHFSVNNPLADQSCGCGVSFSVKV